MENVTIILPLPVKDGFPAVGDTILTEQDFDQSGISVSFTQSPYGLNITGSTPLNDYNPWFVIIHADEFVPANGSYTIYKMKKQIYIRYKDTSEFRLIPNPIGREALINPKYNFSWKEPLIEEIQPANIRYKPYWIPQQTAIFIDYEASPSTQVTVLFSLEGQNFWKQWYDAGFLNTYQELFSDSFTGEKHGWYLFPGKLGSHQNGNYPNLAHPEWQKALNQTAEPERRSGMEIYEVILAFFRNKGN